MSGAPGTRRTGTALKEDCMERNDRTISRRPDGSWANKKDGSDRASSLHQTQGEADGQSVRSGAQGGVDSAAKRLYY